MRNILFLSFAALVAATWPPTLPPNHWPNNIGGPWFVPDPLDEAGGFLCDQMKQFIETPIIKAGSANIFTIPKPITVVVAADHNACRKKVKIAQRGRLQTTVMIKPDKKEAQLWCTQVCGVASAMGETAPTAEKAFWQWCGEKVRQDRNAEPGAVKDLTKMTDLSPGQIAEKYGTACDAQRFEFRAAYAMMIRTCDKCITAPALAQH